MADDQRNLCALAASDTTAPTSSSYWVVPGLLLCGAYPGAQDPDERRSKVQALVGAGVQTFINLMEEDETNYAGEPFVPYDDLAREFCADARCVRHPIKDLYLPSPAEMKVILAAIDESLTAKQQRFVKGWLDQEAMK